MFKIWLVLYIEKLKHQIIIIIIVWTKATCLFPSKFILIILTQISVLYFISFYPHFIIPHFLHFPSLVHLHFFCFSLQWILWSSSPLRRYSPHASLLSFGTLVTHRRQADFFLLSTCFTRDNTHFCLPPVKIRFLQRSTLNLVIA